MLRRLPAPDPSHISATESSGAALLRETGAGEMMARVAELHTGSGLTSAEITQQKLPLPARDYLPSSLLEKLICYADKFYSKSGDMGARISISNT